MLVLDEGERAEVAAGDGGRGSPGRSSRRPAAWALTLLTEIPAAILVVVEVGVLFAGVLARYVFDHPLVWTDELAGILFLWLAMLGAVIALRRGEHMRLTFVLRRAGPRTRAVCEAVSAMVPALFVLLLLLPSYDYVIGQWAVITPALGLHDAFRVAALFLGILLMLPIAALRLAERAGWKLGLAALAAIAVLGGILWLAQPWLLAIGNLNLLIYFVVLVALAVGVGVPIAFAFGIATLAYLANVTSVPLTIVVSRMDEGMSGLLLLAVPLFVFLGLLIEMTGLARAMVNFLAALLGHVRGGLSYVLLGAMFLISGISGSKAADMAAVAPVLFPEMTRRGAEPGELVSLLASSGAMSETIPPSLVLITIGSVTGVSIAALFDGGLLPAAVAALALVVIAYFRSRGDDVGGIARAPAREILRTFLIALPGLVLPFLIRAVVVEGVATATEVSTVGVVYTVLIGLTVYRPFDWKRLYPVLVETASLSGAILLIIGTATAMAWALTSSGFSQDLVALMAGVPGGKGGFIAVSILVFTVLGSVLEGIPAVVLLGPLLFPVARAIGVNEVHYAIIAVLAMGIGLFAPPFGVGYYAACAIGRTSPDAAMGRIWPYLAAVAAALVIVAAVPALSIGI